MANPPLLLVLSGPSGVGKTTIIHRVLNDTGLPAPIIFSISATTRKPRPGESNGVDYYFVTEADFRRSVAEGAFLEWAEVHGALYGTPRSEINRAAAAGADLLLEIDVQGAMSVRAAQADAVLVFLYTTEAELRRRLHARESGLSPEELEKLVDLRMRNMRKELEYKNKYDYFVINEDLDRAVDAVVSIVKAEKCRIRP
jgi:guanylate kinase